MNTLLHTDTYTLLGFAGMLLIVIAYYNNQTGKMPTKSLRYSMINLIGSIWLLISLLKHFNLGSFLIEVFWILISIMGIIKYWQALKNKNKTPMHTMQHGQDSAKNPEKTT
jgi:predicted membrane protein